MFYCDPDLTAASYLGQPNLLFEAAHKDEKYGALRAPYFNGSLLRIDHRPSTRLRWLR